MNVEHSLTHLRVTHSTLEKKLVAELNHPAADPFKISELKRQKLKIKDQIARLSGRSVH